jgi:ADP-heptose:LPS heptosyltransferase
MENILLIRLKSMGDVLFTLPAVNVVREHYPRAKITFLTSRENAPLLKGFRAVDEIISLDRARLQSGHPRQMAGEIFPLLRQLRRGQFSRTFDFQGYGETELLSWWTGAPERRGIVYQPTRGWTYTGSSPRTIGAHPAEWNLDLLRAAGLSPGPIRNEYALPESALAQAQAFFAAHQLECRQPTLFVQPFTSTPVKNWPLRHYLEVAGHWRSRGMQIIFGGSPAERTALEPARAAGFVVAAGAPLLVSAGLTKLSTLILGGDTGLLHVAVAMGKRVVMLMRVNDTGSSHPFQHPGWTVKPAAGKTMADIETSQVLAAIERVLTEPL